MSSTKKKLLVANWKANVLKHDAQEWVQHFSQQKRREHHEYVVCPPQPLVGVLAASSHPHFTLGAQDASTLEMGAYTGESPASILASLGVRYVILGHSERRKYFKESSIEVAQKAELVLAAELTPIICLDSNQFEEQTELLNATLREKSIFAYEPVHAISTFGGQEDPLSTTLEAIAQLREYVGNESRILYGGSVDLENSLTYLQEDAIDGLLVGKSSLNPEIFAKL